MGLGLAGAVALGVVGLRATYDRLLVQPLADIATGEKRRAKRPPEQCLPGFESVLAATDVRITRTLITLRSKRQIFYQLLEPVGRKTTHLIVFFHGFTSNCDMHLSMLSNFARQGASVVCFDLPGHGLSDGLLFYIPDWWALVAEIWEFLEAVAKPLQGEGDGGKPLKMFVMGISLGGGLATCLTVLRPNFFDGAVLMCPMLFVKESMKPPKPVQLFLRGLLGPLKLTWPVTPSKELKKVDFRVAAQGEAFERVNPVNMRGLKPRLATALELGLVFPEWMEKHLGEMETPFIVLHSRADLITDCSMSERLYKEAKATDKTFQPYEDAYHCELYICNEAVSKFIGMAFEPEQVASTRTCMEDIRQWLAARVES